MSVGHRQTRAEAPSQLVHLRLSPIERAVVTRAAATNRQSFSAFARDAMLTAASECLEGVELRRRRGHLVVITPRGVGR